MLFVKMVIDTPIDVVILAGVEDGLRTRERLRYVGYLTPPPSIQHAVVLESIDLLMTYCVELSLSKIFEREQMASPWLRHYVSRTSSIVGYPSTFIAIRVDSNRPTF